MTARCQHPGCPEDAAMLPLCRRHLAAQGGKARANKLSPEQRSAIARKGGKSRKPPRNPQETPDKA